MCHYMHRYYNGWHATSIASLPSVRIISEIYLPTATLTDNNNPSSDALLTDNS